MECSAENGAQGKGLISPRPQWSLVQALQKHTRCAALYLEAHEGCMAKPGVTNMLAESWKNPYPKGKVLIRNRSVPPDQPSECRGKNLFNVVAHRPAGSLQRNQLIDTSIQKVGISGSCLEHTSTIWHQIQVTSSWSLPMPLAQSLTSSGLLSTTSGFQRSSQASSRPTFRMCSYA